jgi:hypothetical protein
MALSVGKRILQSLTAFKSRKYPGKDVETLADTVAEAYGKRNEIVSGGVVTLGTGISSSALPIDMTEMGIVLKGFMMAPIVAQNDDDLFATASDVGQAIYSDGATAAGISLANPSSAYVTVIACNSDGAGGADEADGGTPLLVAVVAGVSGTLAAAHLTSAEIQAALDASTAVHAGVTGWVHVCSIIYSRTGASTWTAPVVMNRNNVLGS